MSLQHLTADSFSAPLRSVTDPPDSLKVLDPNRPRTLRLQTV
jgi:hypothetical protein